ncbi:hypothetical protein [Paenibacillus contaminans]|uniref:Uncharacterized protein n=1 Tax=Paenibacillus contaminans TaxID=450362 RepID=A0A329MSE9_9BACL|nr:hypothetical protein [Paenibacillus contaminans]RAV22482.1 hypothetical protein DQG23_05970 [Paenibacillus contaminans]
MDEKTLRRAVQRTPFAYPLLQGAAINRRSTDPKLHTKCSYLTVVPLNPAEQKFREVFVKPDTMFLIADAVYNYGQSDFTVQREIVHDAVPYEKLAEYIGEENVKLVDERIYHYFITAL